MVCSSFFASLNGACYPLTIIFILFYFIYVGQCGCDWLSSSVPIHSTKLCCRKQKFKVLFYTHLGQEARTHTLDGILAMKQLVIFCNSQTYRKKEGSLNILPTVKNLDYYSVSSC